MKRIATITAIAALAVGATATTASARPCTCDGDGPAGNELTLAWAKYQHQLTATPAKEAAKPAKKKDNRPAKIVYNGRH